MKSVETETFNIAKVGVAPPLLAWLIVQPILVPCGAWQYNSVFCTSCPRFFLNQRRPVWRSQQSYTVFRSCRNFKVRQSIRTSDWRSEFRSSQVVLCYCHCSKTLNMDSSSLSLLLLPLDRRLFGWFIVNAQTQPLIQAFVHFIHDEMTMSCTQTCQRAGRRRQNGLIFYCCCSTTTSTTARKGLDFRTGSDFFCTGQISALRCHPRRDQEVPLRLTRRLNQLLLGW